MSSDPRIKISPKLISPRDKTQEFAIKAADLGRRFGKRWAVRDLDLAVPKGSVYGFLGLNGAGKSTTIRMLMGLLTPHTGKARVVGYDPQIDDLEVKRRVGYVPDTPNFYEWMTVNEIVAFVAHYRRPEWDDSHAEKLLEVFELPRTQKLETLSKGQRAKVSLTLALGFNPEILILDEPTLGLDPIARRQFVEGLLSEFMEGDRTVFISSHLINEIAGIVDHVGILRNGELIRSQRTDALLAGLKRIRLVYEQHAPASLALDGMISFKREGREAVVVMDDFDPDSTSTLAQRAGATQALVEELTLEEAFVELAGQEQVK